MAGRRRGKATPLLLAIALAGLAVAAVILVRRMAKPVDPLAGLTAMASGDSAVRLIERGRYLAALPYLEHVEVSGSDATGNFDAQIASVLVNAANEGRDAGGRLVPATRSTIERIDLVRQALARLDVAERKATQPAQRRDAIVTRGGLLAAWGFVREGYIDYRRANAAQDLQGRRVREAAWLEMMFHDPRTRIPAAVGNDSAPR
jgi:hypothetical protein